MLFSEHSPDVQTDFQELRTIRVIEKYDDLFVAGNSYNHRLKSKNRASMHGNGFAGVG